PVETPTEVSKAVDTGAGSTPDVPKDTEEAPTKTVDGQNQAADTDVALLEPAPDNVANGAEVITPVAPETTPIEDAPDLLAMADPALKSILPKSRPPSIATIAKEFANSLTASADPALSTLKPKIRPANLRIFAEKVDPLEIEVAIRQAVGETLRPALRPKSLGKTVARTNANAETTALITKLSPDAARGTSKTGSPSPVNIQKEATEKTRFNKKRMSLIGVFGKPSARHALLRMPSGRFVKVVPGQKVSGWKVAAIGESTVRITKGSRNQVLRMPK
ncbi:MAG: hypothetical protein IME92_08970, partial [Proteobacteria bacterium]|nr:hypothetical protein [Pseudomonadota bacterium]